MMEAQDLGPSLGGLWPANDTSAYVGPDYKKHDLRGWCGDPHRGAALGRPTILGKNKSFGGKLVLRRIRLIDGDYDCNGTYFGGGGAPLYWCASDDCEIDFVLRAASRDDAKRQVAERYPQGRFYR
jgi:hypothetical protein